MSSRKKEEGWQIDMDMEVRRRGAFLQMIVTPLGLRRDDLKIQVSRCLASGRKEERILG